LSNKQENNKLIITGSSFEYSFDMLTGFFSSLILDGKELLNVPLRFNTWRAPTDNDKYNARPGIPDTYRWHEQPWRRCGFDNNATRLNDVSISENEKSISITAEYILGATAMVPSHKIKAEYTVFLNGFIKVQIYANALTKIESMPRFGMEFILNNGFENVEWFGRGPYENYEDKYHYTQVGRYNSTVNNLFENYIKPQENGSRGGCLFMGITNGSDSGLAVLAQKTFSFNASHYTAKDLDLAHNAVNLVPRKETVLNIDYRQYGIGSGSCGPDVTASFRNNDAAFSFGFTLAPYKKGIDSLDDLYLASK
jgi:beta-galactosidase